MPDHKNLHASTCWELRRLPQERVHPVPFFLWQGVTICIACDAERSIECEECGFKGEDEKDISDLRPREFQREREEMNSHSAHRPSHQSQ